MMTPVIKNIPKNKNFTEDLIEGARRLRQKTKGFNLTEDIIRLAKKFGRK